MDESCVGSRRAQQRAARSGSPASWSIAFVLLGVLGFCHRAHAQLFNSDRPGFAVSSQVVGKGHFQIETGASYTSDAGPPGVDVWNAPLELRYGAGEDWELRLETDGPTWEHDGQTGRHPTGYSDVTVGTKWLLRQSQGLLPAAALVTDVTGDTGSKEFRGDGLRPRMRVELEWGLPDDGTLGVMPGFVYDNNAVHHFINPMLGIAYSRLLTEKFGTFFEVAGQQFARAENGGCIVTYGGGGTYLIRETVQLDFSVSRAANENSPRWNYGAGFSVRL